jgi:hypothetical protein
MNFFFKLEFAESQKGPISNHQFNEAINGVFRSKKNEYKKTQHDNTLVESMCRKKLNTQTDILDKGQKTLQQVMNTNKGRQSDCTIVDKDKENNPVGGKNQNFD